MNQIEPEDGLTVLDDAGRIDRKAKEVLAMAKEYDVAVFTGNLSPEESLALGREAQKMGFKKLIFCHPDSRAVGATMEHIKEMAQMGFFVEFTFLGLLPAFYRISIQEVSRRIKEIGAERSVLTTDSFFEWAAPPSEMLRMFIASLLTQGITGEEIEIMARKNPCELLNV